MVKPHYTNRRQEGLKLGQIVNKNLRKDTANFFAKCDARRETPSLELILNGKGLTDNGLREVVDGLQDALRSRNGVAGYKLEELNLAGNRLTTASLRLLAPVIRVAAYDLKDLDLSGNDVSVTTEQESRDWEVFLESFRCCRMLRRLDLSGNNLAGPRPFEILTRVYCRHLPVDPTDLEDAQETSFQSPTDEMVSLSGRTQTVSISTQSTETNMAYSTSSLSTARILKRRCGLRAVPYIILSNVSMTDAGALHLSYIIPQHYYPQHLLPSLKVGPAASQLEGYDRISNCWGLIHESNEQLTGWGHRLLEQSEAARQELLGITDDGWDGSASKSSYIFVGAVQSGTGQRRRVSGPGLGRRRSSTVSSDSAKVVASPEAKRVSASDIESSRKKLQRSTIEEYGPCSVELWRAAINMLKYSRAALLVPKTGLDEGAADQAPAHGYVSAMTASSSDIPEPILAITGMSDAPMRPQVIDFSRRPFPNSAVAHASLLHRELHSKPGGDVLDATIEADDRDDRDPGLAGNLPKRVWQRIVAFAAVAHDILSEEQQKSVVQYAQDRRTLVAEMEVLGKPESVQIWRTLEGMGCLAYEMKL